MTNTSETPADQSEDGVLDAVTDPAYWAQDKFRIKAPAAPPLHSKLSCLECSEGTAYGDGTGGYQCFRCGWSS